MKMPVCALLLGLSIALPSAVRADDQTVSAETISGIVTRIDYASGKIHVQARNGRTYVVTASPSTTIAEHDKSSYEDLSDVRPGEHVHIEASRANGHLDAEVITLGSSH
jgi:hypothetical protein